MVDRPWRVFISHTTELRSHPHDRSYLAAACAGVVRAGHVPVEMSIFDAEDLSTAEVSVSRVRGCDVHVTLLGYRYGTLVPDGSGLSYTELEYETAGTMGMKRLAFRLDEDAQVPASWIRANRHHGDKQEAFLARVSGEGERLVRTFATHDALEAAVCDALRLLAEKLVKEHDDSGPEELPPLVLELARRMLHYAETLPRALRGASPIGLGSVYVRQSVRLPTESREPRGPGDEAAGRSEFGPLEDARRRQPGLDEPFDDVIDRHEHLVIEGRAGLGKTTLGRHIVIERATALLATHESRQAQPIPVLISARSLVAHRDRPWEEAVAATVDDEYRRLLSAPLPASLFGGRVGSHPWWIVVDALDEIPSQEHREELLQLLAVQMTQSDTGTHLFVTSRPLPPGELDRLQGAQVGLYELQPFDEGSLVRFAEKRFPTERWPHRPQASAEFLAQVRQAGLETTLNVPLLAEIAARVFEAHPNDSLPASRYELYREYFRQFGPHRRAEEAAALAAFRDLGGDCPALAQWVDEHRTKLLETLAIAYTTAEEPLLDVAENLFRAELPQLSLPLGWQSALVEWLQHGSLLTWDAGRLRFVHQTFAEHLAATAEAKQLSCPFRPQDAQCAKHLRGLLQADEPSTRVLVHYLELARERGEQTGLIDGLQAGSSKHRLAAGRLLTQAPKTATDLQRDRYLQLIEDRVRVGDWLTHAVPAVAALAAHAVVRDRLLALTRSEEAAIGVRIAFIDLLRTRLPNRRAEFTQRLIGWTSPSEPSDYRYTAAAVLGRFGGPERERALETLSEVARRATGYEHRAAAEELARLGDDGRAVAADALRERATGSAFDVPARLNAAVALAKLGSGYRDEAGAILTELATDAAATEWHRRTVADELASLGGNYRRRAADLLLAVTRNSAAQADDRALAHAAAARILPEHRPAAAIKIASIASDPAVSADDRREIARELATLGVAYRHSAAGLLREIAADVGVEPSEQLSAASNLAELGPRFADSAIAEYRRLAASPTARAATRRRAAEELARTDADPSDAARLLERLFLDTWLAREERIAAFTVVVAISPDISAKLMAQVECSLMDVDASDSEIELAAAALVVTRPDLATLTGTLLQQRAASPVLTTEQRFHAADLLADVGPAQSRVAHKILADLATDPFAPRVRRLLALQRLSTLPQVPVDDLAALVKRTLAEPAFTTDILSLTLSDGDVTHFGVLLLGNMAGIGGSLRAVVRSAIVRIAATDPPESLWWGFDWDVGEVPELGIAFQTWCAEFPAGSLYLSSDVNATLEDVSSVEDALHRRLVHPHANDAVRVDAASDLARTSPRYRDSALAVARELADSPRTQVEDRIEALATLTRGGTIPDPELITGLSTLAHDKSLPPTARRRAISALASRGEAGWSHSVSALAAIVSDATLGGRDRLESTQDLCAYPGANRETALAVLEEIAVDPRCGAETRVDAAIHLARFPGASRDRALRSIKEITRDVSIIPQCRVRAIRFVARFGSSQLDWAIRELSRLATNPKVEADGRKRAATALSDFGLDSRPVAIEAWASILRDESLRAWHRCDAAHALARLGPSARVLALELLRASGDSLRSPLAHGLLQAAAAKISGGDPPQYRAARETLTRVALDAAAPGWERHYASENLMRLSRYENTSAFNLLDDLAADKQIRVWERRAAAETLARYGPAGRARARESLRACTSEPSADPWEVTEVWSTLDALDLDDDNAAAEKLFQLATVESTPSQQRVFAAKSLITCGTWRLEHRSSAAQLLSSLARDPAQEPVARWMAAVALEEVGGAHSESGHRLLRELSSAGDLDVLTRACVLRSLAATDVRYRPAADDALRTLVRNSTVPAAARRQAARILNDGSPAHRLTLRRALGEMSSDSTSTPLNRALALELLMRFELTETGPARIAISRVPNDFATTVDERCELALAKARLSDDLRHDQCLWLRDLAVDSASSPSERFTAVEALHQILDVGRVTGLVQLPEDRESFLSRS